jgi:hypothetical protein
MAFGKVNTFTCNCILFKELKLGTTNNNIESILRSSKLECTRQERKEETSFHPPTKNLWGDIECGGKEPEQGMKLNFKKHNLSPQTWLRISYLPSQVILTPVYRKEV